MHKVRLALSVTPHALAFLALACGDEIKGADDGLGSPTAPSAQGGPGGLGDVGIAPINLPSGNAGAGSGPAGCIELAVGAERLTPTVLVLVDRSSSMSENFGNSDRWNVLRDTLIDPANGIIAEAAPEVRFGLSMYTSLGGNAGPGGCPLLIDVDIALNNFDTIRQVYSTTDLPQMSDTPTSESIRAVTARLMSFTEPGPKAIILATDGDPDTCVDPDDHSRASQVLSETAVEDAFALGIRTFVISVGDEVAEEHLQNVANLGVGSARNANEPFYRANNAGNLLDAFTSILTTVAPCEFELNGTVAPADAARGTVTLAGAPLGFGQDWDLPSPNRVRLLGETCREFQQSGEQVDISFPCGTFVIN